MTPRRLLSVGTLLASRKPLTRPSSVSVRTMAATNGAPKSKATTYAARLKTGRALALDVWSIFKYVQGSILFSRYKSFAARQTCHPTASTSVKVT